MRKVTMFNIGKKIMGILTAFAVASVSFVIPVNAEPEDNDDYRYEVEIDVPSSWHAGDFDVQVDGVPVSYEETDTANRYKLEVNEDSVFVTAILYNGSSDSGSSDSSDGDDFSEDVQ